jgi:hypothetical protein
MRLEWCDQHLDRQVAIARVITVGSPLWGHIGRLGQQIDLVCGSADNGKLKSPTPAGCPAADPRSMSAFRLTRSARRLQAPLGPELRRG